MPFGEPIDEIDASFFGPSGRNDLKKKPPAPPPPPPSAPQGPQSLASTTPAAGTIRLFYLDKRVKGEAIRLALVVGGIDFEDVRCSYEEVAEMRASSLLPFGQVPALQIGGDVGLH